MGQEVVGSTGIHGHVYPGACKPKFKDPTGYRICRFGKKTALDDGTGFIQLETDPEDPSKVRIRKLDERPENTFGWSRPLESTENSMVSTWSNRTRHTSYHARDFSSTPIPDRSCPCGGGD
jgi:hypothetical protein